MQGIKRIPALSAFFLSAGLIFAQAGDLSFSVLPSAALPLGPSLEDNTPYYSFGGGATLRGDFTPAFLPWAITRVFLDYEMLPLKDSTASVSFLYAGGALGASYSPSPRLSLRATAGGGLYLATADAGTVRNPFVETGAEMLFRFTPTLAAVFGGQYKYLTAPGGYLYQGVSMQLGLSVDIAGSKKGTNIRFQSETAPVYPLFYAYYDKNPLGKAVVTNNETLAIEKIKVEFYVKQYMDSPRLCGEFSSLGPGKSLAVPVYSLFNDSIFKVTEGTKTAGEFRFEYYYLGRKISRTVAVTVQIQNRNAMTWDDDRKAAAFITAKDPQILAFSKGIASMVRADKTYPGITSEFRTALAVYQALRAYGLGYAVDPATPFTELSGKETAVDFLQFPTQTLSYKAGDCDDLSILYAALLEGAGIETALITTPGHIFVAFNSALSPKNAQRIFSDQKQLIVRDETVWIPVEITLIKEGFLRSWMTGASEWNESEGKKTAAFYPVREAWSIYEPVGFVTEGISVTLPSQEKMKNAYLAEYELVSSTQIDGREAELNAQIQSGKNPDKAANRLGILYAQFGLMKQARAQFQFAIQKSNLKEAIINMGNVEFMQENLPKAKEYYEKALGLAPSNVTTLVGLARTLQALGDNEGFLVTVDKLRASDADAAELYFPTAAE